MSISISSIFLMSVLVLGFASYPSISPLGNVAFAQEEIEIEVTDEVVISEQVGVEVEETEEETEEEEEEIELRGKIASIGPGNQFTLESGEVILTDENTDFDDFTSLGDLEVGFEVDIDAVLIDGNLLATEIEVEEQEEFEEEAGEVEPILFNIETPELKIRAEILGDQSEVKVELEFSSGTTDVDSLIAEIIEEFSLTREQADEALKIEEDDDGVLEEEKFEVEVEIEDGVAEVEVELRFVLDSTDREDILDAIVENTQLTTEQIQGSLDLEIEEEKVRPLGEKEVICHIPPGNPSKAHTITVGGHAVDRHLAHGDVIGPCDGQEFSSTDRLAKFGEKQAEREARLAEKQAEREARLAEREAMLEENESEREARLAEKRMEFEARLAEKESKALQRAEDLIQRLEQRIADLELRLQTLLNKVETGEYFGTVPKIDPVLNSYSISIDGTASSLFDESVTSDVSGEIFIENLVTTSKVSKFKVTGGEIFVGDNIYDVVFGKARISSSGSSGEKDTMVLILQAIDSEGNGNTIRLSLDFESALEGDFGTEPIELEIIKNSKISGQWSLSASGQLSLL